MKEKEQPARLYCTPIWTDLWKKLCYKVTFL